jgi:cysteinyl-tRNA synthetase
MMTPAPLGQPLTLFNSISRAIETFKPIDPAMARVYSCGPTVYHYAHLGNLRAYVFTDTLRRVLAWKGWPVTHVINITDVGHLTSDADEGDDKMEAAAKSSGRTIWDIAAFYTAAFKSDIARLNIIDPSRWSVATDHIAEMIAFAKVIEQHGAAYELDSGLYFDVTRVPDYGRLAGAVADEEGHGRIAEVEGKRHPADFALWRRSPKDEQRQMEWESPWGKGAPGWHLECSVMSMKYLGEQFDIHTGGIDHREIHHCNEIAQNQAYTSSPRTGANFWIHNNFLVDRSGKMSKSKGGITTLNALVERGVHPLAYRLLCLSAHYRSELEFSGENVTAALTRLKRLVIAVEKVKAAAVASEWLRFSPWTVAALPVLDIFDEKISADLMTPAALPLLEDVLGDKRVDPDTKLKLIATMDEVLGLRLLGLSRAELRIRPEAADITEDEIEAELDRRQAARAAKNFALSDQIRDTLGTRGVEVMDGDPLRWDWKIALDD